MVMGVSCFLLYERSRHWWYAVLAGVFLSWAPLFKQTGLSALGAVGLFVLLQPVLKHRSWKEMRIRSALVVGRFRGRHRPVLRVDVEPGRANGAALRLGLGHPGQGYGPPGSARSEYLGGDRLRRECTQARTFLQAVADRHAALQPVLVADRPGSGSHCGSPGPDASTRKTCEERRRRKGSITWSCCWRSGGFWTWPSSGSVPNSYEQYYLPLNASAPMLGG